MDTELHPELKLAKRFPRVTKRTAAFTRLFAGVPVTYGKQSGVDISDHRSGDANVRTITPQGSAPSAALLWIHGGGMVVGSPRLDDWRSAEFARELGIMVVAPYYRLAPKHPYPAAIDDCWAAWQWLVSHAEEFGVDTSRIALGGESAGGGLAATLAQRIHDGGGVQPAGQLLIYPMLDDRTAARRELDAQNHLVWNNQSNHYGWSSYLGREPGGPDAPPYAAAARRSDLQGLPPCWIGVGTLDLFLEEDREYARRLEASGVECTYLETEAACHGFIAIAPNASVSRASTDSQIEFLRTRLGTPSA